MSTVLYSNGQLHVDSGAVMEIHDTLNFDISVNKPRKLIKSSCGCTALAMTGNLFTRTTEFLRVVDYLAERLKEHGKLSKRDDDLSLFLTNLVLSYDMDLHFIVMTSIDYQIFVINYDRENLDKGRIDRLPYEATYSFGTGTLFTYTAIAAGKSPMEAMHFTVDIDNVSSYPILSVTMDELTTYHKEDSNDE